MTDSEQYGSRDNSERPGEDRRRGSGGPGGWNNRGDRNRSWRDRNDSQDRRDGARDGDRRGDRGGDRRDFRRDDRSEGRRDFRRDNRSGDRREDQGEERRERRRWDDRPRSERSDHRTGDRKGQSRQFDRFQDRKDGRRSERRSGDWERKRESGSRGRTWEDRGGSRDRRDVRGEDRRDDRGGDRRDFRRDGRDDRGGSGDGRRNFRSDGRRDDRGGDRRDVRRDDRGGRSDGRKDFRRDDRSGGRRDDRRRDNFGGDDRRRDAEREERMRRRDLNDLDKPRFIAPDIDDDVTGREIDKATRRQLEALEPRNAERVAQHLVMAARYLEADAQFALEHANAAVRKAGRIAVVREATGVAAYAAEDYALALKELRTHRRISGSEEHLPLIVDCQRALGKADKALEEAQSSAAEKLDAAGKAELAIVVSGIHADAGDNRAALEALQIPQLDKNRGFSYSPRLFRAYAEALRGVGRDKEAPSWERQAIVAEAALGLGQFSEPEIVDLGDDIDLDEAKETVRRAGERHSETESAPADDATTQPDDAATTTVEADERSAVHGDPVQPGESRTVAPASTADETPVREANEHHDR